MLPLDRLDRTIAYSVIRSWADREVVLMHGDDIYRFWQDAKIQKFLSFSTTPNASGYIEVDCGDGRYILVRPVPEVEVKRTIVTVSIAVFGNVLDFNPIIECLSET